MASSLPRAVIVPVALVGVVMLVWAATAGPSGVVGTYEPQPVVISPEDRTPLPGTGRPETPKTPSSSSDQSSDLAVPWLGDLLSLALLAAALVLGVRVLRWVVAHIPLPEKREVLDLEPVPDPEAARAVLTRDRQRHREALGQGDVRNGIVACWVQLEESAEDAGIPRRPAETPTEFIVHLLHALDVDPRPVAALAGLYHEARFSSHRMDPQSRSRAEAALDAIHLDLHASVG
jgi:hypothetical protein